MRRVSEKQKKRNEEGARLTEALYKIFKELWDEQEDELGNCYCFESGRTLPGYLYRGNSACYHHVLEKGKMSYPEYAQVKKNIIIIHPEIHQQTGRNIDLTPKIKEYREHLLSLHYKNELK